MTFQESIKSVFSNYATIAGRATRSEYWYFALFNFCLGIVFGMLGNDPTDSPNIFDTLSIIYSLAVLVPSICVGVRRLHDIGKGGQWMFIVLIPLLGAIWLIVLFCETGEPYENRFGPAPEV